MILLSCIKPVLAFRPIEDVALTTEIDCSVSFCEAWEVRDYSDT